jgi:hypothetical protein
MMVLRCGIVGHVADRRLDLDVGLARRGRDDVRFLRERTVPTVR